MIGLLVVLVGIPATFSDAYIFLYILLNDPPIYKVRVGSLVGILLAVAWALITAAIAWERSGIPVLIVGDNLEYDGLRYRLSLHSKDKPYDTNVRLLEIVTEDGRNIVPLGRLNLDMDWTHYGGGDVHIKKNHTETVGIATIRDEGGQHLLRFTGARHSENIHILDRAYFHLRIAYEPKPIDRWFCFHKSDGVFPVTNEAPPTQSAIPA